MAEYSYSSRVPCLLVAEDPSFIAKADENPLDISLSRSGIIVLDQWRKFQTFFLYFGHLKSSLQYLSRVWYMVWRT